jgi:hypothetical protein
MTGGFPQPVPATGPRAELTAPTSWCGCIIPTNTICRRCPIPYSSQAAMRFTGPIRRGRSVAPPRTGAFALRQATRRSCTIWCNPRAPGSVSPGRHQAPASLTPPGTGNITVRLPMRQQGMRQSRSGPGRPILSSDPSRNGPRGRNAPNAVNNGDRGRRRDGISGGHARTFELALTALFSIMRLRMIRKRRSILGKSLSGEAR